MQPDYVETLPPDCPPTDAHSVDGVSFYRFVKANPATENDFISHRKRFPTRKFDVSECQACSISLFRISSTLDLKKLPTLKKSVRATITLKSSDGIVKKTGDNEHHSWWRSIEFTIGNNITY